MKLLLNLLNIFKKTPASSSSQKTITLPNSMRIEFFCVSYYTYDKNKNLKSTELEYVFTNNSYSSPLFNRYPISNVEYMRSVIEDKLNI